MEKQKGKKPSIRFSEFKDLWDHKVLNELLYEAKSRNSDLKYGKDQVLSVSGELGIVNQIEHLGRSYAGVSVHQYHIVEPGDIVYTKSPLKANPFGIIKLNKGKAGIVSTLYAVYKVNSKTAFGPFIDYYFSLDANTNRYLRPLVKKGAKNDMKINNADVLHDRIYAPPLPEQQKIASFLSAVDEKIRQLKRKKELLEQYKKGVMQQIFERKIRFKDEKGKEFPEWEEKRLGEVSYVNPKSENLPSLFTYIDLESVEKGRLVIEKQISRDDAPSRAQRVLRRGDILFQTVRPYQMNNLLFDRAGLFVASTGYAQLRTTENSVFLYQYLHTDSFNAMVMDRCTGTSFPAIKSNDLAKITIQVPVKSEQQKIATFLSSLDKKIELVTGQVEKAQEFKKGLLQQMFV